jgi:hypothetical protein
MRKASSWIRKRRRLIEEAKKGNLEAQRYCHFQLQINVLHNGEREIDLETKFKEENGTLWRLENRT